MGDIVGQNRWPTIIKGAEEASINYASMVKVVSSGGGGGMEARIAKLETDVEYIKRDMGEIKVDVKDLRVDLRVDFRTLFGALIIAALGLAALMAHGFGWIK